MMPWCDIFNEVASKSKQRSGKIFGSNVLVICCFNNPWQQMTQLLLNIWGELNQIEPYQRFLWGLYITRLKLQNVLNCQTLLSKDALNKLQDNKEKHVFWKPISSFKLNDRRHWREKYCFCNCLTKFKVPKLKNPPYFNLELKEKDFLETDILMLATVAWYLFV